MLLLFLDLPILAALRLDASHRLYQPKEASSTNFTVSTTATDEHNGTPCILLPLADTLSNPAALWLAWALSNQSMVREGVELYRRRRARFFWNSSTEQPAIATQVKGKRARGGILPRRQRRPRAGGRLHIQMGRTTRKECWVIVTWI